MPEKKVFFQAQLFLVSRLQRQKTKQIKPFCISWIFAIFASTGSTANLILQSSQTIPNLTFNFQLHRGKKISGVELSKKNRLGANFGVLELGNSTRLMRFTHTSWRTKKWIVHNLNKRPCLSSHQTWRWPNGVSYQNSPFVFPVDFLVIVSAVQGYEPTTSW